ncbi:MAG: carbon-nitrogen family hydrolase [Deltaproteobacteria bacterium]|jgi:predicted amidohydrolase|nr:carbon-nitrogen family hydrolase [Deltaproteobacteria bacterium]
MTALKISALQFAVVPADRKANMATVARLAEKAMADAPDVLVLPEMWDIGFITRDVSALADPDGREAGEFLGALARKHQVNIVGGSIARKKEDKLWNTCYVLNRAGSCIAAYDKIHLFSHQGEDTRFQAGNVPVVFDLDGVRSGVVICYDLRFGELSRMAALAGARILFVPAAWPEIRLSLWQLLLRARAVENQLFVAGVNICGRLGSLKYPGSSLIAGPSGEILAQAEDAEACLAADCDLAVLEDLRAAMPFFQDLRPDVYRLDLQPE